MTSFRLRPGRSLAAASLALFVAATAADCTAHKERAAGTQTFRVTVLKVNRSRRFVFATAACQSWRACQL